LDWINGAFPEYLSQDLKNYTFGLFKWNSSYLGYNDGYLSLGFTLDFRNSSLFDTTEAKLKSAYNLEDHPDWPVDDDDEDTTSYANA